MPSSVGRRSSVHVTVLVATMIAASGCSSVTDPENELAQARRLWGDSAPAAYSITISRGCFCPQEVPSPVVVAVRNGVIESRHYKTTGAPVSAAYADGFPGVDGLFDVIEDALKRADRVDATYDPTLGYPVQVSIDYIKNAIDDELAFGVTDLTPRT